jgi:uncharacterized membrane protein YeaQ/YmgE (transglycosylase-associated protein family)
MVAVQAPSKLFAVSVLYSIPQLTGAVIMSIGSVISWLVFGLVVGAIARLLLPGRQAMSWLMTIVLGVVGSFAGGAISGVIFGSSDRFVQPAGWIMSIIGALIVLFIYSRFAAPR